MIPQPVVLGLNLCDYLILEEGTRKVSLIGMLPEWHSSHFPFQPAPFFVHVALTDGLGDATIDLAVNRLDTGDSI